MSEPKVHIALSAEVAADPDRTFTFFTDRFGELWPGKMDEIAPAPEGSEAHGLGYRRRIKPPGMPGHLDEEITVHERPSLIEYRVINDDSPITNHVGRIRFSPGETGTRIDYTIDFDYSPSFLAPVAAASMKASWKLKSKRLLERELGG